MINVIGVAIVISTLIALFISMRASHNKILGFIALCAIGFPFVIANYVGEETVRYSQSIQLVIMIFFAIHAGSLFVWFYLHKKNGGNNGSR